MPSDLAFPRLDDDTADVSRQLWFVAMLLFVVVVIGVGNFRNLCIISHFAYPECISASRNVSRRINSAANGQANMRIHSPAFAHIPGKHGWFFRDSFNENIINLASVTSGSEDDYTEASKKSKKIILSGVTVFIADSNGSFTPNIGTDYWNTLGGDQAGNLWITRGTPPNGLKAKFINGPTDAKEKISIKLDPGVHKFTIYGNDGTPIYYHGLNLFFDGNNEIPLISAYAPTRTDIKNIPTFLLNNAAQTIGLGPGMYTIVPGAGTLIYKNGKFTVRLTKFFFAGPDVFQTDRTSSLPENPGNINLLRPDGKREFIGSFTLEVMKNAAKGS